MGFTTVERKWRSPEDETAKDSRRARTVYIVTADADGHTPAEARLAIGSSDGNAVPRDGDPHAEDFWKKVVRSRAKHLTKRVFEVDIQWEYTKDSDDPEEDNPLDMPPQIRVSYLHTTEQVDTDIDGKPIATVLGEPFEPLQETVVDRQVSYTVNRASYDATASDRFEGHVNATPWHGWAAYAVKCDGITATKQYNGDLEYYQITFTLTFRDRRDENGDNFGWKRRVAHKGYYVRWKNDAGLYLFDEDTGLYEKTRAKDKDQNPVTRPVYLTALGDELPEGDPVNYRYFKTKPTADFNQLDL